MGELAHVIPLDPSPSIDRLRGDLFVMDPNARKILAPSSLPGAS